MVPDTPLLNTYKVRIKAKIEQSRERSSAHPLHLPVEDIERGVFWTPLTTVANFTLLTFIYIYIYIYMCVCVSVCLFVRGKFEKLSEGSQRVLNSF